MQTCCVLKNYELEDYTDDTETERTLKPLFSRPRTPMPKTIDFCKTGQYKKPTECGVRNVDGFGKKLESNIANASYALYGEFPWMMAIMYVVEDSEMNKRWKYRAAGSLIHPKLVITAAHR